MNIYNSNNYNFEIVNFFSVIFILLQTKTEGKTSKRGRT